MGIFNSAAVIGNVVRGNASHGVQVFSGVVTNTFAFKNGGNGIDATFASVTGNQVRESGMAGIRAGCPSSVVGNAAVANAGGDILTAGSLHSYDNAPAP